jgi:hypothetical protein
MFGQLTTGLESAWNKLRGVGAWLFFFFIPTIKASFLLFFHALRGYFHEELWKVIVALPLAGLGSRYLNW